MANTAGIEYSYNFAELAEMDGAAAIEKAKQLAKGSPITALALILGTIATQMTENLMELATKLGDIKTNKEAALGRGEKPGDMNETYLTALLQSETQKLSMFMQALSGAIKALGEGETSVARK